MAKRIIFSAPAKADIPAIDQPVELQFSRHSETSQTLVTIPIEGIRVITAFLLIAISTLAQTVAVQDGNVLFTDRQGHQRMITSSRLDAGPSLSVDAREVIFVRRTPGYSIDTGLGPVDDNELWVAPVDGHSTPHRVLRGRNGGFDPAKANIVLGGFSRPQFSPNGTRIYFQATTWATSFAVHVLDRKTGETAFLYPGGCEVLRSGKYAGFLIATRTRIVKDYGRILEYWLSDPQGKSIRRLGGEDFDVERFKKAFQ